MRKITAVAWFSLITFLITTYLAAQSESYIIGNSLLNVDYTDPGDLNIGAMFAVSSFNKDKICGEKLSNDVFSILQKMEILAYTVRKVNANATILPGIKLGFTFLDYCSNVHVAMMQAKRFLPRTDLEDYIPTNETNRLASFKVIGVVETSLKHFTVPMSILFAAAKIPILSFWDGWDELSDKGRHKNFLRITSTSWNIMMAMANYLKHQNWNLFTLVIQDLSESKKWLTKWTDILRHMKLCAHETIFVTPASDFDSILEGLIANKPRVVMAIVTTKCAEMILAAVHQNRKEKLLWLVTDSWLYLTVLPGSILFSSSSMAKSNFYLDKSSLLKNPWFQQLVNQSSCNEMACVNFFVNDVSNVISPNKGDIQDATFTYAHALKNLFDAYCPGAKGAMAVACFEDFYEEFPTFLQNVTFKGKSGEISFDSQGDQKNVAYIYQNVYNSKNRLYMKNLIATFTFYNDTLKMFNNVSWEYTSFSANETSFKAGCHPECSPREYKIYYGCCWSCKMCQEYEIVTGNESHCANCPPMQWPTLKDGKYSLCSKIEPTQIEWFEPVSIFFLAVDTGNLVLWMIVLIVLRCYCEPGERDSPYWLLILQLLSTVWGIITVPMFLDQPSDFTCSVAVFLFVTSLNFQYKVIFFRAVHIFRASNELDEFDLQMTSTLNITVFLGIFFLVEMVAFTLIYQKKPIRVLKTQSSLQMNYVEKVCKIPEPYIVAFLIFAFLLLMLSSVTSMKTKKQPTSGYDQSRFLLSFILISLICWIIFMPAFFIVTQTKIRMYLMISVVLLNHLSALLLSYTPRLILSLCVKKNMDGSEYIVIFRKSVVRRSEQSKVTPPTTAREVVTKSASPEIIHEELLNEEIQFNGSPV